MAGLGWFLRRISFNVFPPRAAVETSIERIGLWQGVPGFLH